MAAGTVASLSSGTYTCTVAGMDVPPLMLADAVRTLRAEGVHLVAAAGNDAITAYFYPAAFDEVLVPVDSRTGSCPYVLDVVNRLCRFDARSTVTAVGSLLSLPSALASYKVPSSTARSVFSNHGTWVKAWADGDQIVASYVDGPFRYCVNTGTACDLGNGTTLPLQSAPTAHLGARTLWSGTSFAAPMVAMWLAAGNKAPA
jgi:subtilisin family serine protease